MVALFSIFRRRGKEPLGDKNIAILSKLQFFLWWFQHTVLVKISHLSLSTVYKLGAPLSSFGMVFQKSLELRFSDLITEVPANWVLYKILLQAFKASVLKFFRKWEKPCLACQHSSQLISPQFHFLTRLLVQSATLINSVPSWPLSNKTFVDINKQQ